MDDRTVRPLPPLRPERQFAPETTGKIGDVARPLTFIERLTNMTLVRRLVVIVVLAAAWEIYARILDNPLLFPSLSDTLAAFWDSAAHGVLIDRTLTSLRVLGMGYAIGLVRRRRVHHACGLDPRRHRFPVDLDRDVQSAAGDRAVAAGAAVVRPRRHQHRVRHRAFGAVGGRAQHPFRISLRQSDLAHGRTELRADRPVLCHAPPRARRVSVDPHRPENRLGVCLAHA